MRGNGSRSGRLMEKEDRSMRVNPTEVKDKKGRIVVLRNAEASDAERLMSYIKITAAETPFLMREPDEFSLTLEQERKYIQEVNESPRSLLLIGEIDGEHVGNCALMCVGAYRRYAHRCQVSVALYQKYCGAGIGEILMEAVLSEGKKMGYEQAELEVVSENKQAIRLYRKLGFEIYGTFPNNMKYLNGIYRDAFWMMKKL